MIRRIANVALGDAPADQQRLGEAGERARKVAARRRRIARPSR
jgi:hypothetical protein